MINQFGRSPQALRLVSAVQVLAGMLILAVSIAHVWSPNIAILTTLFTLSSGLVYKQSRLFRPDPMMLGWELAGLGLVLLAVHRSERRWWLLAGSVYGVAFLWKPFGMLPLVGFAFYFADKLWHHRAEWRNIVGDGLLFGAGFLVVGVGGALILFSRLDFYYGEALSQHLQLGQDSPLWRQIAKLLFTYFHFLYLNLVWLLILPLWWINRPRDWPSDFRLRIFLWQLVSPIIFLALTRPLFPRYYFFLTPVLAFLLAWQIDLASSRIRSQSVIAAWLLPLLTAVFALAISQPNMVELLTRKENDTLALATYIKQQTEPDDIVLSDYATINFFADRDSIYEASIIAGGRIKGQIVTGELLIDRLEASKTQMVLLHVAGGEPEPHQLVELVDYPTFRAYLLENFDLLELFDRAGQQIEVYKRK